MEDQTTTSGNAGVKNVRKKKRPLLALALSLLAPGVGQYYNDQGKKAVIVMAAYFGMLIISLLMMTYIIGFLLLIIPFLVWLYAMGDAFLSARKINRASGAGQ